MKTNRQQFGTSQKTIALAILAIVGSAHAEDDITALTKPDSSISVGAAGVSGPSSGRTIYGQYNGMRKDSGVLQLDFDYLKRNDETGTWTSFRGRNLGLDNRELGAEIQKQGDWKITGDYSELVKHDLRTINTADLGVGTANPTVVRLATPGTGSDVNLKLKRVGLGLGVEKWITPALLFEASFKNEDKDGARFWGRGYDCAAYVCASTLGGTVKNAVLMVAEPVNSTTRQFEAKFIFHDEKLNLSAGYYGSFYTNANGTLTPAVPNILNDGLGAAGTLYSAVAATVIAGGGTSLQDVLQQPMALPPDNQAHQFSLSGNYAFTPTTKATFTYAYTRAIQNRDFIAMGLSGAPAGVSSLGGKVDSTLAQFGLTAKPIAKLSLLGNLRYEKKDDKTPSAPYNLEARTNNAAPPTYTNANQLGVTAALWDNNHVSNSKLAGKLEASYLLPANVRATLGVDYNAIERIVPRVIAATANDDILAGLGPLREKTAETGYRLELRRAMSETLTGAIGYSTSKRRGSKWSTLSTFDPASIPAISAANLALVNTYCGGLACYGQKLSEAAILGLSSTTPFPMHMANLDREKWKLSANWTPIERLSLQFSVEDGKDRNTSLTNVYSGKGYRGTKLAFYNFDADFAISDKWKLTGYWSYGDQGLNINHSTGYVANLKNRNDAAGLGLLGKPTGRLDIGANLTYLNDATKYEIAASPGATGAAPTAANVAQAAIGLPDVTFRQTTFTLFGKYAMEKNSDIRVSLVHQRSKLNEWTWGNNGIPWLYADNTTVRLDPTQSVTFLGAAYIYKFQ